MSGIKTQQNKIEVPEKFNRLLNGIDLKSSYLNAWNADVRSTLEEEFIAWCDNNKVIEWN